MLNPGHSTGPLGRVLIQSYMAIKTGRAQANFKLLNKLK